MGMFTAFDFLLANVSYVGMSLGQTLEGGELAITVFAAGAALAACVAASMAASVTRAARSASRGAGPCVS